MGNLRSVAKAVESLGKRVKVTDSKEAVKKAKKIIFPGVGHFGKAVRELKRRGIFQILKRKIKEGTPFLGICLGMQLLLEKSQEAPYEKGLGVIKGEARRFSLKDLIVPHMGWNRVDFKKDKKSTPELFCGIKNNSYFYFAHSYYCKLKEDLVAGFTNYGIDFISFFNKDNIWAVQFHPEKSQKLGLKLLNNFLNLC
jgi:glutamine amidotransferase